MQQHGRQEPGITAPRASDWGTRQFVVGMMGSSAQGAATTFWTQAMHPFLPLGLALFGATRETRVLDVRIGNACQVWPEGIPGEVFSTRRSFEELACLAALGELPADKGAFAFETDEVVLGQNLSLRVDGPCEGAAFWGLTYLDGVHPFRSVEIGKSDEVHEGRVVDHRLRGREVVFVAKSPTEEGCCRLLETFLCGKKFP
jgi:hypothetical protein